MNKLSDYFGRIVKVFDFVFETLAKVLGSTPVIVISIAWCAHSLIEGNRDFLDIISMVTFIYGELILRGQSVQSNRTEKFVKIDLNKSNEVIRLLKARE